jgi:hypothetical protein
MNRIIIAAASAALLAAAAAPALADDYPPCTHPGQDHCRVTHVQMHGHRDRHHHHVPVRHHHHR